MTETPAAFLVAAALAGLARGGPSGRPWAAGVRPGGALPPQPAGRAPLLTILAGLRRSAGRPEERLVAVGLLAMTIALVLLPWMIRNLLVLGEPIWTTTHGGYTLALANNPVYYREVLDGPPGRVWTGQDQWLWWDSVNRETAGMTEPQADRYLQEIGLALWHSDAGRFRPRLAGPSRPFLGRRPGCLGLSRGRSMGHDGLDRPPLDGPRARFVQDRSGPGREFVAPMLVIGSDARPRLLLDRPPDAGTDRAGDRAGRRKRTDFPGGRWQERPLPPDQVTTWPTTSTCGGGFGSGRREDEPA